MKVFLNANPRHCEEPQATRRGGCKHKKGGPEPAFSFVEKNDQRMIDTEPSWPSSFA